MPEKITALDIASTIADAVNWDGEIQRADVPSLVLVLRNGQRFTVEVADATSYASCGHPANDDGECGCSSWPERAPLIRSADHA